MGYFHIALIPHPSFPSFFFRCCVSASGSGMWRALSRCLCCWPQGVKLQLYARLTVHAARCSRVFMCISSGTCRGTRLGGRRWEEPSPLLCCSVGHCGQPRWLFLYFELFKWLCMHTLWEERGLMLQVSFCRLSLPLLSGLALPLVVLYLVALLQLQLCSCFGFL